MRNDIAVVTMATKFDRGMYTFLDSCERFNIMPIILGIGLEWKGCCHKLHVTADALDSLRHYKKLVLFVDAYDSIFVDDIDAIVDEYGKIGAPLVYSGDKICFPDPGKAENHPPTISPYRFLNAGGIIGETALVADSIECIRRFPWKWEHIDQDLIMADASLILEKITIDTECRIFQTLYNCVDDLDLSADRIYNKITNSYPKVMHGNGRQDMKVIENWLKPSPNV